MKKTYLTPAIEIESIVVEQGIAMSPVELQDGFGLGDDTNYSEGDFEW